MARGDTEATGCNLLGQSSRSLLEAIGFATMRGSEGPLEREIFSSTGKEFRRLYREATFVLGQKEGKDHARERGIVMYVTGAESGTAFYPVSLVGSKRRVLPVFPPA